MKDAAAAAAMSDPDQNHWFRRRWVEPTFTQLPVEPTTPPPTDDFELVGIELLAAWRRERLQSGGGRL